MDKATTATELRRVVTMLNERLEDAAKAGLIVDLYWDKPLLPSGKPDRERAPKVTVKIIAEILY